MVYPVVYPDNVTQTCSVWPLESHWQVLAMHSQHGYTCSARQPCVSLTEALCLSVTSTGKVGHWDATQKPSGNGKDLHILIVISTGIVTARKWYLSFYWVWRSWWDRCLSSHKVLVQAPKHWWLSTHGCWRDNFTVCLIRGAVQCLRCFTTAHLLKFQLNFLYQVE